ncbi:ABC transporter permease [Castellaniella sp. GW247-6E4]|uniref:ABC transporter permease n=1 Tax=Castellaniella sp. GW247-6E4 TaxID=3140380 RepID=UPI003315EE60
MLIAILRRLAATIPVVVVVAVVVFAVIRLTPGDPASIIAGDGATVQQIELIRQQMGLDQPIAVQFYRWVGDLMHGDFGTSLISGLPVQELLLNRMGPTIALTLYTILFVLLISLPTGVLAAWKRGQWIDKGVSLGSVIGFSMPSFITAYILIFIFSIELDWLPVQGYEPLQKGIWAHFQHMVLPVAALSTVYVALVARFVRSSVIDTLGEDYIRTARAKGLKESRVLMRHALPNASVPILTIIGIVATILIAGLAVIETVFNIPGLGRLVLDAIQARDFPVIQAMIILLSLFDILINLVVDILYLIIDPRIES